MHIIPHLIFILLLYLKLEATLATKIGDQEIQQERGEAYCPSHCYDGYFNTGKFCSVTTYLYCCNFKGSLQCCSNSSLKLTDGIQDDYNCYPNKALAWLAQYWEYVLGVCVPLALISIIGALALCTIQNIRRRRRRRREEEADRDRSNSAVSGSSNTSTPSTSSWRSGGVPPPPTVVITTSNGLTTPEMVARTPSHFLEPPPYTADKPPQYWDVYPG